MAATAPIGSQAPVRIVLVDGHRIFRAGIRKLLEAYPGLAIIADVDSGDAAIKACSDHGPDVMVSEVRLPDISGIDMLRKVREQSPRPQVLFLTVMDDIEVLVAAAEAGCAGYVLKDISPDNLANGILAVHRGSSMIHPTLARRLLGWLEARASGTGAPDSHGGLDEIEKQILSNVASGLSDREIAMALHLSEAAVKKRLRKVYVKLGARNRAQAALVAIERDLIPH